MHENVDEVIVSPTPFTFDLAPSLKQENIKKTANIKDVQTRTLSRQTTPTDQDRDSKQLIKNQSQKQLEAKGPPSIDLIELKWPEKELFPHENNINWPKTFKVARFKKHKI